MRSSDPKRQGKSSNQKYTERRHATYKYESVANVMVPALKAIHTAKMEEAPSDSINKSNANALNDLRHDGPGLESTALRVWSVQMLIRRKREPFMASDIEFLLDSLF